MKHLTLRQFGLMYCLWALKGSTYKPIYSHAGPDHSFMLNDAVARGFNFKVFPLQILGRLINPSCWRELRQKLEREQHPQENGELLISLYSSRCDS